MSREDHLPVRRVEPLTVNGARRRGRPKLRWEDRLKTDLKELLLSEDMTSDRSEWRTRIRCFFACLPASLLLCRYVPLSMPACLVLGFFACLLLSFAPVFRFFSRVVCFDALYLALLGVFLEAVPLPSGRGVTVYISPPPYPVFAGLGNVVVVVVVFMYHLW
ncbi:hypothetical protein Tco_1149211 [Tanacetum coccineum]